jgi:hypothetical protein
MGLLKTAATVAVASSVHGRIQRRQQARWAAQDQAPADVPAPPPPAQYAAPAQQAYTEPVPPPPAPAAPPPQASADPAPQASADPAPPANMNDRLAQLKQLGELLSAGILTQAEFEQQKARILNG